MSAYVQSMRIKHWIKNALIFTPLFFSGMLNNSLLLIDTFWGILSFCFMTSVVYIVNDIADYNQDRIHPTKCKRPIASGRISIGHAKIIAGFLEILSIICLSFVWSKNPFQIIGIYILYLALNLFYSIGRGKNIPFVDIIILASGFLLRVMFGSAITGITISDWLYLVVISGALYLGLGKRRNELKYNQLFNTKTTRKVLKYYTYEFLDKNMYMSMTMMLVFYALWCSAQKNVPQIIWTVPVVIIIAMRYSMDIENSESDGDPMEVILRDKVLVLLVCIYALLLFLFIYCLQGVRML